MKSPGALESLVNALSFLSEKMKRETLEVLAALCLVTLESHRVIFNYVQPRFEEVILCYLNGDSDIPLKVFLLLLKNKFLFDLTISNSFYLLRQLLLHSLMLYYTEFMNQETELNLEKSLI